MSKNNKEVKEHELKIWPEYFDDVESGRKTFEVRKLDRLFGKGDTLLLREWSPIKGYSGRETRKVITYVMAGGQWGLAEGNCILGIQPSSEGSGEVGLREKQTAITFYNWLHEEGYSFSDKRYYVYLGGKNYWIFNVYKKFEESMKEYTLPSNVEGRRFTEGEVYELLNMAIVASRDKSFTNLPDWWDKNIKK